MAILRDVKTGETFKIHLCKFCTDYKGDPKPIMPDDFLARREKDGSYKCGTCIKEEIANDLAPQYYGKIIFSHEPRRLQYNT